MLGRRRWLPPYRPLGQAVIGILLALGGNAAAEQVTARYQEGVVRGLLVLRTLDGNTIAGGEMNQSVREGLVTNRLTFHFHDGSLHDETAEFTQDGKFRLVNYHLVQKGPAFPNPMEVSIDGPGNRVRVRHTSDEGEKEIERSEETLPADIANGLTTILVKNIAPGTEETVVSMVGTTPEPQLVDLRITEAGEEPFSAGGVQYEATHYVVEVDIGAFKGLLAKLLDKHPPNSHIWVVRGKDKSPGFVRAERPFYMGAPLWRIELTSPVWSQSQGESQ